MKLLQQLLALTEAKKKPLKNIAKAVYKRDYQTTKNRSYRKYDPSKYEHEKLTEQEMFESTASQIAELTSLYKHAKLGYDESDKKHIESLFTKVHAFFKAGDLSKTDNAIDQLRYILA